ncbi:hypothetical protein N7450_002155 [Penicillium hetheringtonii]|uniref:PRISE-like Rossmann-fold domain-containing protein n=1 Tax=Penicillium hetheringtonii TaxID=911720 RepID=A0AAD6DVJ3_9EURO|nr:hypothetical protein N7450_002155 [Penicillium hetheringtonii]
MSSEHAIVYGASSVVGWSIVDQILKRYPENSTFSKVTAITNRPLDLSNSYWPTPDTHRPKLQLVSGFDLRDEEGPALAASLKEKVNDVEGITTIYYSVFTAMDDDIEEVATNLRMLRNVIDAHNILNSNLKFVTIIGGTRGYGIYAPGGTFTPPLREDMVSNLPADYAKTVVYPAYRELLYETSQGQGWTWCEVCPDAIIGFTPNGSQFSLALHWAQYLSLYAYNHGKSRYSTHPTEDIVKVPFPGNPAGANSLFTPVSSKTIARFMIYASLHSEECGQGSLFNIADHEEPCTYGEIWSKLAEWFGLEGVGPVDDSETKNTLQVGKLPVSTAFLPPGEYITKHQAIFSRHGCKSALTAGVGAGNRQLDSVGYWLTFDRQLSLEKVRNTGFEGNKDPIDGWIESFEMFRKAGLIL